MPKPARKVKWIGTPFNGFDSHQGIRKSGSGCQQANKSGVAERCWSLWSVAAPNSLVLTPLSAEPKCNGKIEHPLIEESILHSRFGVHLLVSWSNLA